MSKSQPVAEEFLRLRSLHSSFAGSVPMKLQKSASGSRLSNQDLFLQQQQNPIANSNGWSDVNHRSRTQSPSLHGAVLVNQGDGSVFANGAGITVHQNENGDLGGRGKILMGSVFLQLPLGIFRLSSQALQAVRGGGSMPAPSSTDLRGCNTNGGPISSQTTPMLMEMVPKFFDKDEVSPSY